MPIIALFVALVASGCAARPLDGPMDVREKSPTPHPLAFAPPTLVSVGQTLVGGATVADFDADGRVALATAGEYGVTLLLANETGGFRGAISLSKAPWARNLVAADLDRDGDMDLAVARPGSLPEHAVGDVIVLTNDKGTFAESVFL